MAGEQVVVQESAESYKARKYAEAMAEAQRLRMDEGKEGGEYVDAFGRTVNARGEVVAAEKPGKGA